MSSDHITRRAMLAASAGVLAGGLVRPRGALAALSGPPHPSLAERYVGRITQAPTTIVLTQVADLLGVQWLAPSAAHIELRFRGSSGPWSRWVSAGSHGHGPEAPDANGGLIGEPLWTGGASEVQLRSRELVDGVRLHLIDVSGGVGARVLASSRGMLASSAALALAAPELAAGPGQPPIIARRAWAQRVSPPRVAPEYGAVRMAFVHHTDNPNGYSAAEVPAMLRAIYVFHRYVNGWNDIGYNFVLDLYGRIFEARAGGIDESVVGAHAGGYNRASSGIAVLGTFSSVLISAPARAALERLLAWKLSLHGLPSEGRTSVRVNPAGAVYSRYPANTRVSLPRIAGHRDADSTDCPGDALYGELPAIRRRVLALAPQPTQVTLTLAAGPPPELSGSVQLLDGTPVAGAPVLLQTRTVSDRGEVVRERTLNEVSTDAQGNWSASGSFSAARAGRMWVRALCVGGSGFGAAVAGSLRVPFTAEAGAPVEPVPTPPVAAPGPP